MRPPVRGEASYSHSHYGDAKAPKCGLAVEPKYGGGICLHPREPGMPWCNRHLSLFMEQMKTRGYTPEAASAYMKTQPGWDVTAVECFEASYRRFSDVPTPTPVQEPDRGAQVNVSGPATRRAREL